MYLDDSIVRKYINGEDLGTIKDNWIYKSMSFDSIFEYPDAAHRTWVSKLDDKLKEQITRFIPRNIETVQKLFPDFNSVKSSFTVMFVVGFPDPYDAMVMEHEGKEYMIFDLIQFGEDSLNEDYCCHRVLTHELIHMCLHNRYPVPQKASYLTDMNYTAFDEGFAHALTFPDDLEQFEFDSFLEEKYQNAKQELKMALNEHDPVKQEEYRKCADTGEYWNKFASISGKLYLLKHKDELDRIYRDGWEGFARKIIG